MASLVWVKSTPCPGSRNIVHAPHAAPSQVEVRVGSRPARARGRGSDGSLGASKGRWLRRGWVYGGKSRARIGTEDEDTRATDCWCPQPPRPAAGGGALRRTLA